jgi:hypothetical protein
MVGEAINAGVQVSKLKGMQGLIPLFDNMSDEQIKRDFVHDETESGLYYFDQKSTTRKVISPSDGSSKVRSEAELMQLWIDKKAVILQEASDGIEGR